jgi:tellurite resistance protein TerA
MNIQKGQRVKLSDFVSDAKSFEVEISISGITIDMVCFGLDNQQMLSNDAYMTFFNQPKTPCGAVELSTSNANSVSFLCQLDRLPSSIKSLIFTAAIVDNQTMRSMRTGSLKFQVNNQTSAQFIFSGQDFQNEKAVKFGEIYRKDGAWRFMANGQGFNGGLDSLVKHFGGEVLEETKPTQIQSKLSLSKITLEKTGDKISLKKPKEGIGYGRIICNLNWVSGTKKGFFSKGNSIDLDLACLYELTNGTKMVVQALGKCFGSYENSPYIHLAGDDRTGANTDGEFIYINGDHLKEIRRICVFAFIYDGAANWLEANAVVTVNVPNHPLIEVKLDSNTSRLGTCAIAMIENDGGELKVTKLNEYFQGHIALDQHYTWGVSWGRPDRK